jgi:hypothetical protein
MRKISVGAVLAVAVLALLVASPASAQDQGVVVAGGWAPAYGWASGQSEFVPLGLFVNGSYTVAKNVAVLADFGWQNKTGVNIVEATGGVRYWVPVQGKNSMMPFVEGSAGLGYGGVTGGSATGFAFGFGGGVDVPIPNHSVGVRVQVNYYRLQLSGLGVNAIRFGIGISGKTGG